uniref:Si:ch211-255g12.6 n=1 Tax=Gasterosteus aculeatus TaxID=69293 RepID=G3PEW5_GASAC
MAELNAALSTAFSGIRPDWSTAKMPGTKGNKSDKKSATKQPQSPKEQPKKAEPKGDDTKKQGGQPKGEKQ